jgi:hypothetical protein
MNTLVQRVLDGELPREALTAAERAELESFEQGMGQVLRAIPEVAVPGLSAAVLRRIEVLEASRTEPVRAPAGAGSFFWGGLLHWLWAPRPVALRPAWALAAAAVLVAGLLLRTPAGPPAGLPVPAGAPSLVLVHFQFEAPAATEVRLAGDFSSWQPTHTMSRSEAGVWSVVVPLSPGIHEYAFVVDGTRWQVDPGAPAVADGFGGHNSRVAVLTPDVGAL